MQNTLRSLRLEVKFLKQNLFLFAALLNERRIKVETRFQQDLPPVAVDKNLMQSVFRNLILNAIEAMPEKGVLYLETRTLPPPQPNEAWPQAGSRPLLATPENHPPAATKGGQKIWQKFRRYFIVEPATPACRVLLTKLPPEKQVMMITFRDNGCGISKEILEQLFLPFVTTKKGGNGLGLALSHKIIQEHHGTITVDSREGFGTTFTILLPA